MEKQDTEGRGSMQLHVRALLIKKFKGEKNVNLSEAARQTGMHYNTWRGYWEGTVTRIDNQTMVTLCWYFGVNESKIWSYIKPKHPAPVPRLKRAA